MTTGPDISQNFTKVRQKIEQAAAEAGRSISEIDLCAVSKTFSGDQIRPALETGHKIFGENRVQEAEEKWPALRADYSGVELHLIGPLQTNKVKKAVALFDVIQTLDRPRLARALSKEMKDTGRNLPCYVQVNTGEEPQKAGVSPIETTAFVESCRSEFDLDIAGLMCIPPHDQEPSPHFALLQDLAAQLGLTKLSMGMSADYPIAVEFGATVVRVGSAIFGARSPVVKSVVD